MKKTFLFLCYLFYTIFYSQKQPLSQAGLLRQIKEARVIAVTEPAKGLKMLKEYSESSKKIGYRQGIIDSDNAIMIISYWKGDYKNVIEISLEAEKIAQELEDYLFLSDTYRLRGVSYIQLGIDDIGLKELKKSLIYTGKIEKNNSRYLQSSNLYDNIGQYFDDKNGPLDSVLFYKKKSLEEAMKISKAAVNQKYQMIAFQYMNLGIIYSELNNPAEAEKYLLASLKIYKSKKYPLLPKNDEVILYSELGRFYYKQKKYEDAIQYSEKGLLLEKGSSTAYIRKDMYEILFKSYLEMENQPLSKKYSSLYVALSDSIARLEKKGINTSIRQILSEKDVGHDDEINKIFVLTGAAAGSIAIAGWIYWRKKNRKLHTKYLNIIENIKITENLVPAFNISTVKSNTVINITDDIVNSILMNLEKFEKSHKYLKKDLTIGFLALELNTNTRYLSQVLKQYKGKNYTHYINGLRINYIINKLYENPVYRKYKISYLAEVCGFSSREAFASIFKKETGMSPFYFINNLKKDNDLRNVDV